MSIYSNKMVDGVVVALSSSEISELEERDAAWAAGADDRAAADARDKFVRTRMKTRPGWRMMFLRYEQSSKALDLINYILKRYLRSKK